MRKRIDPLATLASATEAATQGRAEVREVTSRAGITVTEVGVGDLMVNPANPPHRATSGLEDLAETIRAVGVLQPLVVRPRRDGDPGTEAWMILGGHRRWAAAKLAGLRTVPVHVSPGGVDVQKMLIENLQRTNITPMEEARSYQLLRDQGFKQTEIAKMVAVSQGQVSKRLSLLKLDEVVQDALEQGKVGLDAVYSVLNDTEPAVARQALRQVAEGTSAATSSDLRRAVQNVEWEQRRAADRQKHIDAATTLGAKVVARGEVPEGALRTWGEDAELAEAGGRGHLYFVASDNSWSTGEYFTDDPEELAAAAEETAQRTSEREREERERGELRAIQQQAWARWAESIPEQAGPGEGAERVARHVLTRALDPYLAREFIEELGEWLGVPFTSERKTPYYYGREEDWLGWIDTLSKAQLWRATRIVVDSASMRRHDLQGLYEAVAGLAPDLAARWVELNPEIAERDAEEETK